MSREKDERNRLAKEWADALGNEKQDSDHRTPIGLSDKDELDSLFHDIEQGMPVSTHEITPLYGLEALADKFCESASATLSTFIGAPSWMALIASMGGKNGLGEIPESGIYITLKSSRPEKLLLAANIRYVYAITALSRGEFDYLLPGATPAWEPDYDVVLDGLRSLIPGIGTMLAPVGIENIALESIFMEQELALGLYDEQDVRTLTFELETANSMSHVTLSIPESVLADSAMDLTRSPSN